MQAQHTEHKVDNPQLHYGQEQLIYVKDAFQKIK